MMKSNHLIAFAVIVACLCMAVSCKKSQERGSARLSVHQVYTRAELQAALGTDTDVDHLMAMLGDGEYYVSQDTASVNAALAQVQFPSSLAYDWVVRSDMPPELLFFAASPQMEEDVMVTAYVPGDQPDEVQVSLSLKDAARWSQVTAANAGRRLAIVVNGVVVNAPLVTGPVDGGTLTILTTRELCERLLSGQ